MTAPFNGPSPFGDPRQLQVLQGGAGASQDPAQQPPDQQPPDQQQQPGYADHPPIDLEGCIAQAIEDGCHMCSAATDVSAEDFQRFAQGVSFLADAMSKLQPQAQPGPDQSLATAQLDAQTKLQIADRQGQGEIQKANISSDTEIEKARIAADVQRETAKIAAAAQPKTPPSRQVTVQRDRHGNATKYQTN
jgi:hypothetical protein